MNVPVSIEKSRSGHGAHLWIFFEEAISASLARKLGCLILSKTMNSRHQIGLDSYDRLFPNQDTLPKGGFGNLIALPLQGLPRKKGNSIFVDMYFQPYKDQWEFLFSIKKLKLDEVEVILQKSSNVSSLLDAKSFSDINELFGNEHFNKSAKSNIHETLPEVVKVTMSNMVYIEKKLIPALLMGKITKLATFPNSEFYKAQAMRLSTHGKPRVISCSEEFENEIALPRGCFQNVKELFEQHEIKIDLSDERTEGVKIDVQFTGKLTMLQDAATRAILSNDIGILSAATAFGKTVVGANIIAQRKVNTLVLVHRKELMIQWKERLNAFLDFETIGVIGGGGKIKRTNLIDIATIQSMNQKRIIKDFINDYGQIIVDECHHISAFRFEQVLKKANSKYIVGLTATPTRKDGHHPIVMMQCGPIRLKIDAKSQAAERAFQLKVIPRYTEFKLSTNSTDSSIQDIYKWLIYDESRNNLIFDDILNCLEQGRSPILLVERMAHLEYFQKRLDKFAKNIVVLRGGMSKRQREAIKKQLESIPDSEERVLIATGKLIGEGFDDSRLDTLFLVHPISWRGTLQQYAGRLHRNHNGKNEVLIYDYVDHQVPVLANMYKKRIKGYRSMGYQGMESTT
ncbi:TOTE conflict system archaeo-eukaryotic primase domain-containing protein [Chengkuizengella sp. SCS-71B]|uniref:TOTE conflict system archaeo-eukaryotic primase domain-containing protein n=1 Tax=Chengkuizengella sp. SCS-71B TaxID=3115290 RepID=UPI0032C22550